MESYDLAAVSSTASFQNPAIPEATLQNGGDQLPIEMILSESHETKFQLLDLLGRPVRAWSLDVAAGESEVHLNVADVPSGVYFLRVSAPGVEEMRKVVIVH